jgi:hypothetical protein
MDPPEIEVKTSLQSEQVSFCGSSALLHDHRDEDKKMRRRFHN